MSENTVTITMSRDAASALYNCLIVELDNDFVAKAYLDRLQPAFDALCEAMGYNKNDD